MSASHLSPIFTGILGVLEIHFSMIAIITTSILYIKIGQNKKVL